MNNKNKVWTIIFRIFTILLFAFIVFLVCYDFFDTSKSYLTTEIIIALCIAFVIVCIDSFDSFQIGSISKILRCGSVAACANGHLRISRARNVMSAWTCRAAAI